MIKQNIVSYDKFVEEYMNQLKTPSCIPRHVGELCGGWTAETFKQIIQKITKKNTAPLQLWFDSYQSMDIISTKRASLKEVFKLLDTRNISRIDSCELFSVMTFIAKGDYETTITLFGFKNPQSLTKDEFFFFLDSFFRGISKILLLKNKKDYTEQDVNKRLNSEDIKEITDKVYGNKINFTNKDFAREFMKSKYNQFFEYIYQCLQSSNDHERQQTLSIKKYLKLMYLLKKNRSVSLQNIQISQEVRKCIMDVLKQVEKNANENPKK